MICKGVDIGVYDDQLLNRRGYVSSSVSPDVLRHNYSRDIVFLGPGILRKVKLNEVLACE
jgi:hypothetical protein